MSGQEMAKEDILTRRGFLTATGFSVLGATASVVAEKSAESAKRVPEKCWYLEVNGGDDRKITPLFGVPCCANSNIFVINGRMEYQKCCDYQGEKMRVYEADGPPLWECMAADKLGRDKFGLEKEI